MCISFPGSKAADVVGSGRQRLLNIVVAFLHGPHGGVDASQIKEGLVGPVLHDSALIHHQNLVSVGDG